MKNMCTKNVHYGAKIEFVSQYFDNVTPPVDDTHNMCTKNVHYVAKTESI